MRTVNFSLTALTLIAGMTTAPNTAADGCINSFYCYGNSAEATVRTATRPPPIPPPNPNYVRQRNRAQLAARTATPAAPTVVARAVPARPVTATPPPPQPARATPVRPAPAFRANAQPVPPATNRPPAIDRTGCSEAKDALLKRAASVESQAVIASTRGQRQRSVSLFRDAGKMRTDAQRMQCR